MKNIWNEIIGQLESKRTFKLDLCQPLIDFAQNHQDDSSLIGKQFNKIIQWMEGLQNGDVLIEKIEPKLLQSMQRLNNDLEDYFQEDMSSEKVIIDLEQPEIKNEKK
jgi:hypothetical protein